MAQTLPLATDLIDYIFQFPNQGAWLQNPVIAQYALSLSPSQPGVPILVYNPVETLNPPGATMGNNLVGLPQLANSTVALPGFWIMLTIKGYPPIAALTALPELQIINDRTLMFARQPSVLQNEIDVSHINIVINIFGVYVADGMRILTIAPPPSTTIDSQPLGMP